MTDDSPLLVRDFLDYMVRAGWLRSGKHPDLPLWIYNYTEQCQFKKHWTPETLACRGLVLDEDSNIVARPFGKFFNLGEVKKIPREPMVVTSKMDGSLGIIFEYKGDTHVCTRGSFTSEQSVKAAQMLTDVYFQLIPGTTILCEILYPENRIVVNYDFEGLIYLTTIDNATGQDIHPVRQVWHGERVRETPYYTKHLYDYKKPHPDQKHFTKHANNPRAFLNSLAAQNTPNAEGYVVRFESGLRVKVKFEDYVRLHRIISGLSPTRIWDSLRNGDDIETMIDGVPDETYNEVMETVTALQGAYKSVLLIAENVWLHRLDTVDRGKLARYFIDSDANESVLFAMLDGKDPSEIIWKSVRPKPEVEPEDS
jgi:hypothetical protein